MKTFKLKSLVIIENKGKDVIKNHIPLLDGLIINREDEENNWVIEAYIEQSFFDYFQKLKDSSDQVMIEVKITTQTNEPALFITSIIGINEISDKMNVLFKGTIIDQHKEKTEALLKELVVKGYQGESLLRKFKELLSEEEPSI